MIEVGGELLGNSNGGNDLPTVAEAAEPSKKLVGDFHLWNDREMIFARLCVGDPLCTEAVNHRVQERICKAEGQPHPLTAHHTEYPLGVASCGQHDMSAFPVNDHQRPKGSNSRHS